MNIKITTVSSPFSFYCLSEDENNNRNVRKDMFCDMGNCKSDSINLSDVNHGQYVAVLWKEKWVRGIISMESNFSVWLVDHGVFIRPPESTVYVNLPAEYKKLPSKVFEASIHGVTPVGLELDDFCQFKMKNTLNWSTGAIQKAQQLIASANCTTFVPLALLSTKTNDVVLGDLYLHFNGKKVINFIDEMCTRSDYPLHMFMEKNAEDYIKDIAKFYTNRRLHRACLLKPELPIKDLPTITTETTLVEYNAICEALEPFYTEEESDTESVGGSSVTFIENVEDAPNKKLKLTPAEIEKYSNEYIIVGGREYNVLSVLINKARDLYMCEKYKDAESIGRATTRLTAYSIHTNTERVYDNLLSVFHQSSINVLENLPE